MPIHICSISHRGQCFTEATRSVGYLPGQYKVHSDPFLCQYLFSGLIYTSLSVPRSAFMESASAKEVAELFQIALLYI